MTMWRSAVAACACTLLGGCYPALEVARPKVELTVVETTGRAVDDATVTLATFRFPFPLAERTAFATYRTDAGGNLRIRKRRKWVWQVALPDGIQWYGWAYCVEKPGYRAVAAVEPDFAEPHTVVLEQSMRRSVCEWPAEDELYHQVEVVER